ncbi:uncharacterized protein LOC143028861 [Oratosquilla oratoria]|uniref:uncharacterized protein LOC143028861 n=1 Tax=Oratosquilla oratoria TaxID=337810 RepID=UPI003F75F640
MSDSESLQAQICSFMVIGDDEDINDDFLAFIAKGKEYREEWKEYKDQQMGNNVIKVKPSSSASKVDKVHPDIARGEEMGKIYSVDSPQIHAMETATQLSFERISVNDNPALWPNISINIMF